MEWRSSAVRAIQGSLSKGDRQFTGSHPLQEGFVSRILVLEPRRATDEFRALLTGQGHEVVVCPDRESLFDAIAERRPDLLVYVLNELGTDLGVLSVLRRISSTLPIILLGGPAGLEARRSVQELKPTYYGVFPLEPSELSDAVHGALHHHGGRSAAS